MIPLEYSIEAKSKENEIYLNNQNQINREIFENKYQDIYKILSKKDCKCDYFISDYPLYCAMLFLSIIILALIPFIGWIVLIESDLGGIFEENCLN
jgi:hypothetical protein